MQITNPIYLLLLIAIPLFLLFSLMSYHQVKKWLAAFGSIQIRKLKNVGRIIILTAILLLATFSLAGLNVEYERMVSQRKGIDIVIGLDTSRSMLAEDTVIPDQTLFLNKEHPSRLNRGKLEALRILNQLNGERIGLFFFAFRGTRVVDLTEDYGLCNYILVNSESTDITFTGSNLDHALKTGRSMFEKDSQYKVMILISDGELEDASQMDLVVSEARKIFGESITIYTIGIGGKIEVLIPKRASSRIEWFKDSKENILKTRMNEEVLKKIAAVTNGEYFHASDKVVAGKVVEKILDKAKYVQTLQKPVKRKVDLSPIFLVALLSVWLSWETLILVLDKRAE